MFVNKYRQKKIKISCKVEKTKTNSQQFFFFIPLNLIIESRDTQENATEENHVVKNIVPKVARIVLEIGNNFSAILTIPI